MDRLARKYQTAKQFVPKPIIKTMEGAKIGIISVGSTDLAVEEARHLLARENVLTDHMRIRAIPFVDEIEQFVRDHDRVYVVEINRDGQLRQILVINMPELAGKLIQMSHSDGMPLSARWLKAKILAQEES
jgi:2-oxoglutarate ferredoxin oxidoreductase subunit alpha